MKEMVYVGPVVTSFDPGPVPRAQISNMSVTGSVDPEGPFTTSEDIGLLPATPPTGSRSVTTGAEPPQSVESEPTARQLAMLSLRHGGSAGGVRYEEASGTYTVSGSGTDIWNKSDEFHFAWKQLTGDGSIVARVESVQQANAWTKAGVMIRNRLDPNSEHAMVLVTPTGRISFQRRTVAGSECQSTRTMENTIALPHWVKLTRKGDLFTAQHSNDGRNWQNIEGDQPSAPTSVSIAMSSEVYVGLAVTSHAGPLMPAEAKMSNVTATGKVEPPGEFLWSEDIGFQMIVLPKK